MNSLTDIDKYRLSNAWECILGQFFNLCIEKSIENGSGISVFKMLSKHEKQKDANQSNCAYNYITNDTSQWKVALGPYKDEIIESYDADKHVIISVHIPSTNGQDETIGNTRIFNKEKGNPIEILLQ